MKTILVLFGGCSTEYEVSLHSAYAVLSHMDPARYTPLAVGITREGKWLCYTGDLSRLEDGTWQQAANCIPCTPLVEREAHALLLLDGSGRRLLFDAVFPVLHGKNGEDGTVQGLFELAGVPVIGCGTLSSALCMDKDRAHQLAALAGIRVPRSHVFHSSDDFSRIAQAAEELGYPVFVKPVRAGSSFGITKVSGPEELPAAMESSQIRCCSCWLRQPDTGTISRCPPAFWIQADSSCRARLSRRMSGWCGSTEVSADRSFSCRGCARLTRTSGP